MRAALFLWLLALPAGAQALDLALPGNAALAREVTQEADTVTVPTGPFAQGVLPRRELAGHIVQRAWHLPASGLTTMQVLAPARTALENSGWEVLFSCADRDCGGFDFRFGMPVMPAPDMFVDLFDYRFLAARKVDGENADYVSCLVSVSGGKGYVQLVAVGIDALPQIESARGTSVPETVPAVSAAPRGLVETLVGEGHVVLGDLDFGSGSATLSAGPYDSLAALAGFLKADGERRIALVGHTDAVGGLDANLSLSRERAESVRDRLAERHGAPRAQMEAAGVGYLAPIAPNTTAEGRAANRRVEAVLLSGRTGR